MPTQRGRKQEIMDSDDHADDHEGTVICQSLAEQTGLKVAEGPVGTGRDPKGTL